MANLSETEEYDGSLPANAVAPPEESTEEQVEDSSDEASGEPEVKEPEPKDDDKERKEKAKKRLSDRVKQVTWQAREAERKAQALEEENRKLREQAALKKEPKEDDYLDHSKFEEDRQRWQEQERARIRDEVARELRESQVREKEQREYQEKVMTYAQSRESALTEYKDYVESEKLVDAVVNTTGAEGIRQSILNSEKGPQLVDYLGNNPDELERLSEMSPLAQAQRLGKIEASLDAKPIKKTSSAPPPIRSGSGSATGKIGSSGKYMGYGSFKEMCQARNGR